MKLLTLVRRRRSLILFVTLAFATFLRLSASAVAQQVGAGHQTHSSNTAAPSTDDESLREQLRSLQTKVAQLEAALQQNHQAANSPAQPSGASGRGMGMMAGREMMGGMGPTQSGQGGVGGSGMGMMQRGMAGRSMQGGQRMPVGGGMGMMEQEGMGMDAVEMGADSMQPGQGMRGMGMNGMGMGGMVMMEQEGMGMMGQMQDMGSMQMQSALPGFPGASHIYHIGATGFFLNHRQHITLTQEQQAALNRIKQQSLLEQSTYDRSIAQAEQELWILTSSDSPDISQIETKVREVEKLRGDKRIAFIRAVGEAAMMLTDEQRRTLVGDATHETTSADSRAQ